MGLFRWKRERTGKAPLIGAAGFDREMLDARGAAISPAHGLVLQFTRHRQPDPGMAAVSYDSELLPLYSPVGPGIQNKRQWKTAPSNQVVWQQQAIALTTVGNPGNLTGTFRQSGLIDTRSNEPSSIAMVAAPGSFELPRGAL